MPDKKKNSPLIYLSATCMITICVASVGYSAYLISSTSAQETSLSVVASEVNKSGITIKITSSTSQVLFDSMYLDSSGRVTSDSTSETTPIIEVIGYVEGYTDSAFIGVNPTLQVASAYRENYDYLIDNNYIVEPSFAQLGQTTSYDDTFSTENSFYWTSAAADKRYFKLSYEFTYGSFFNYMNPSEFFDSAATNSMGKKGSDYSTAEIREILNRFAEVNEASYTLYLDVMTDNSLFDVTLDAGSGYFSSTDTTATTYTFSDLTYHSKVDPLTPYRTDYIFNYWLYDSSTQITDYFFINELGSFSAGDTITLTASYTPAAASFSVMFDAASSGASVSFNVQSEDGISSYTWAYGDSTAISLRIGDVITITNTTAVDSISASSSVGLTRINSTTFRVAASTCSLYVITIPSYLISFQLSTTTNLTFLRFLANGTEVEYTSSSGFPTYAVTQGDSLTLSNVRGISSFSDGSSSGSSITVTPSGDTTITITPATALTLTVKYTNNDTDYPGAYNVKCLYTYDGSTRTVVFDEVSNQTKSQTTYYYYVSGETYTVDGISNMTDNTTRSGTIAGATSVTLSGDSCILPGTLITMADGSYKVVEDIKAGDEVTVFDHATGKIGTSYISVPDHDIAKEVFVMALNFSNGKTVKVVSEHGFFDVDLNNYVYINEKTYKDFIGHRFFALEGNGSTKGIIVTLDSVDTYWLFSETYSPASFKNLNIITEDILSMPGGVTGVFNIFELDENMKVIPELMQKDIETYGLFTYEEWAEHLTPEEFEAFNVKYVKVAIGKGLNTMKDLIRIAHMVTKR